LSGVTIGKIADQLDRWHLVLDGEPFETPSSWLALVRRGDTPAVLKIPKPESDEHKGAIALAHFGDKVAVRVFEHDDHAILIERAVPGTTLKELVLEGRDDDATHIICDAIERLPSGPAPSGDWSTLEHLARAWNRYRRGPGHILLTPELVDRSEVIFLELCRSSGPQMLLHGDLHHMNILRDAKRGWLIIDPKGVIGEPAYEVAMALHNPIPLFDLMADPKVMARRVRTFAERLKLDEARILKWCFAVDILCHLWSVEDRMDTGDFPLSLRVAETALQLLGDA
jgi:streptomycin 6-kinase